MSDPVPIGLLAGFLVLCWIAFIAALAFMLTLEEIIGRRLL